MLRPVIYSHLRLQCKAEVVGRVSLPTPKKFYIHIGASSVILHSLYYSVHHILGTYSLHQAPGSADSGADSEENIVHINAVKSVTESLVLFHKRLLRVNMGEKTRISQCIYITCNIIRRLNTPVEGNYIRLNLSLITWKEVQSQGPNCWGHQQLHKHFSSA